MHTVYAQMEYAMLDINNFHVPMNPQGMVGLVEGAFDLSEVPAGSGVSAFVVSALWVAAKEHTTGEVMGCIPMYHPEDNPFKVGPVHNSFLAIEDSVNYYSKYNRVWKVSREEIEYHKLNYNNSDYLIPDALLHWPGNGDTTKGEAKLLAPFTDYNQNKLYEPLLGEHPNIKGDEAVYAICNANTEGYLSSKMEIELHTMLYAYEAYASELLDNVVFVNHHIFNRSLTHDYDSLYAGQFIDFKSGCQLDDYTGSDSTLNVFYVYNGDNFDDPCSAGYENLLPAMGCVSLTHNLFSYMIFNGDPSPLSYPTTVQHGYNYLRAMFKDSTHLTYGGDGYGGTENINHIYPSDVHDTEGWSEISTYNTPNMRRGVGSLGPFQLYREGDICIEFAYVFSQADILNNNTASVDKLKEDVAELNTVYPSLESETCVDYITAILPPVDTTSTSPFLIYPNPAHTNITIQTNLQKNVELFAGLYDATGRLLQSYTFITDTNDEILSLDVSELADGLYSLQLHFSGHEITEKIIIH